MDGQRVSQRTPLPSGVDIADFILSYASLPCQGDFDCFQQGSLSLLRLYIHGTATAGDVSNAKAAREKGVDNPLWYVISSILDGTGMDGGTIQQMTRDWARYPTDRLPTGEETCDEFSMQRPVNRIGPGDTAPRAGLELILMTRWIDVFYP